MRGCPTFVPQRQIRDSHSDIVDTVPVCVRFWTVPAWHGRSSCVSLDQDKW